MSENISIKEIARLTYLKKGDSLIISGEGFINEVVAVYDVKSLKHGAIEIILDEKSRRVINIGWFLEGRSWVKKVKYYE